MGNKTRTRFWIIHIVLKKLWLCKLLSKFLLINLMLITLLLSTLVSGCAESAKKSKPNQPNPISVPEDKEVEYTKAALVNVEMGLGYLTQGQVARAKSKLTHALKLAPKLAECHSAMAFFLERVGEINEAEKTYKKAIKYSKTTGAVYNNYGGFLCRQNRFKEADSAFQTSLSDKNYSRTAEVYENAGICALKWQNVTKSQHYLQNSIRQDPKRATALLELANITMQQNNLDEAKEMLTQFKKVSEPTARSLWLNIQLAKSLNDENAVASHALLLKNLFEESPEYKQYIKSEVEPS